jgi:DNA-directed RNA polymerase subunit RPC12/RpoP
MGIFKWFKQTSLRGDDTLDVGDLSVEEITHRVSAGETFAFDVEITDYADIFQACYEQLMKDYGDGAAVLGAWTSAGFGCANCGRSFPSSFKLHLTNPAMFPTMQARSDCPDCGSRFARIAYVPPTA